MYGSGAVPARPPAEGSSLGTILPGGSAGTPPAHHDHLVTFYENDAFLVDSVVAFLARALEAGEPAVAIATADHLVAIERALGDRGGTDGTLLAIDAHEMLATLMVDGAPAAEAFEAAIGGILDEMGPGARAFGEMVAVLWERGDVNGAIALEDLWNELATTRAFELFCAYPMRSFEQEEDTDGFRAVVQRHGSVVPSESYSTLADPEERRRHVALLQQEAAAGVNERVALRRKQAELEDALEKLRELDRLRSEFVAMVVHDIRTPTAVVSGFLDLLREHWPELAECDIQDFLDKALANTHRIEHLVDDILTMSRIDSDEFTFDLRPADLVGVVERAVSQVRDATGRRIEVDRPEGLRAALVDENRQAQILTNLLTNAVKFSPEDTTVRVSVEDRDEQLVVSVHDEGIGISAEDQTKLFRPFSRLERRRGDAENGTGLGLYIAKALVEGQGGTIWVDSVEGLGSTFSYTVLPTSPGR
jgi:signal transduction histidine kinase